MISDYFHDCKIFAKAPSQLAKDHDDLLSWVGYVIKDLVNFKQSVSDKDLQSYLPAGSIDSSRKILEQLAKNIPEQYEENPESVARNLQEAMGLRLPRWFKEKPIINVYRFVVANGLIDYILKANDVLKTRETRNLLKKITKKIPDEIFMILMAHLKSNPRVKLGHVLRFLIRCNHRLQDSLIKAILDNFKSANSDAQKAMLLLLARNENASLIEIFKRSENDDHSEVNYLSHIAADLLRIARPETRSFDVIKKHLYKRFRFEEASLEKATLLARLLKHSHDSSLSQKILHRMSRQAAYTPNFQYCLQLLNYRGKHHSVTEAAPLVLG